MLSQLSIRNVVLIEKADLAFGAGLCVLTGETGAGKSILLDALGLALGARGEASLIRKGAEAASVTAMFELPENHHVFTLLKEAGIEASSPLMLKRQLNTEGKSRAFINDEPVSLKTLKEAGKRLLEIHGQHAQQSLDDPLRQETLLDAFAKNTAQKKVVAEAYADWRQKQQALAALQARMEQALREQEYLEHMERELAQLKPRAGEEAELSDRRATMMQSEKLMSTLDDVLGTLRQPRSAGEAIRSAERTLLRSSLAQANGFEPVAAMLDQASGLLEEAEEALERLGRERGFSAEELERVEERLFALKDAARKYRVEVEQLPVLLSEVNQKLEALRLGTQQTDLLEREVAEAKAAYLVQAEALSKSRKKASQSLERQLAAELAPLKMASARFRVSFRSKELAEWTARGTDAVQFEAAINAGADFAPLSGIASGGELSRFMLAMAVVLGEAAGVVTMIFDEIDSGTGGAVADAIGRRLEHLGRYAQVLVVTHLPQVAARGTQHFVIRKEESKKATLTQVRALQPNEIREELARMLSGAEITEEARKAADRLLASKDAA